MPSCSHSYRALALERANAHIAITATRYTRQETLLALLLRYCPIFSLGCSAFLFPLKPRIPELRRPSRYMEVSYMEARVYLDKLTIPCAIFIYFFTLFSPLKKFNKNICCEGYSKAYSRKIWLWSLSNITSTKNFEKFKIFFSYNFFEFFFSCGIASLVFTTYILFIEIGQAVFKKNHFLHFSFPLHNSEKNEFPELSFGEILLHMDANLWQKTCGGRFCILTRLCPL